MRNVNTGLLILFLSVLSTTWAQVPYPPPRPDVRHSIPHFPIKPGAPHLKRIPQVLRRAEAARSEASKVDIYRLFKTGQACGGNAATAVAIALEGSASPPTLFCQEILPVPHLGNRTNRHYLQSSGLENCKHRFARW